MAQTKILLDTNSYLRLAVNLHPLLPPRLPVSLPATKGSPFSPLWQAPGHRLHLIVPLSSDFASAAFHNLASCRRTQWNPAYKPQMPNQNAEQRARDRIDAQLRAAGWAIQNKNAIDFNEGEGQAVREYTTDCGPADYVLFLDKTPVGVTEAKKDTLGQNITTVENQTENYAAAKLKWVQHTGRPLPFLYEATGVLTRFTDQRDPKPRSREVFTFHHPETLREMLAQEKSLRDRLQDLPVLDPTPLRDCQVTAVTELDKSVKMAKPRALVQMATGSGKTFTSITFIYRLLKHAKVKRVLFLVDTRNLGEQAEQEFLAYTPPDDNRKFTELYTVQRLASSHVPTDAQVCISTIQRMYSILQGKELDESAEDENPAEHASSRKREPLPVTTTKKSRPSSSTSSSSMSATAPSTISGGRSSITSTPSSSA